MLFHEQFRAHRVIVLTLVSLTLLLTFFHVYKEGGQRAQVFVENTDVRSVTSTTDNGTYGVGEEISIIVTFEEPVDIVGEPILELDLSGKKQNAIYISGARTKNVIFMYTVEEGDSSDRLDYASVYALKVSNGAITSNDGLEEIDLTLPLPGSEHSLAGKKTIVINTKAPPPPSVLFPPYETVNNSSTVMLRGTSVPEARIEISQDGDLRGEGIASASGTWTTEVTSLPVGVQTLHIRAIDMQGNESTVTEWLVTIGAGDSDLLANEPESREPVRSSPHTPDRIASCPLFEQLTGALPDSMEGFVSEEGHVQVNVGGRIFQYIDVPGDAWYRDYLVRMSVSYITSGTEAGKKNSPDGAVIDMRRFNPADPLKFGELAKMISLAGGVPSSAKTYAENPSAWGHWSEKYVIRLEERGIHMFRTVDIEHQVSRGAFLQNVIDVFGIDTSNLNDNYYDDLYPSHRHYNAISAATRIGIVYGDTDSEGVFLYTIRPDDIINRSEAIAILDRALRITCGQERAAQVLPGESRRGDARYGINSDSQSTKSAAPTQPEIVIGWPNLDPICDRLAAAPEPQTQSGRLVVSISGSVAMFEDVNRSMSYMDAVADLYSAKVFEGKGERIGYMVGSEFVSEESISGGPFLLSSSGAGAEIRKERNLLYQKFALAEDGEIIPVHLFNGYEPITFGIMAKMLALTSDAPPTAFPAVNPTARYHWSGPYVAAMEQLPHSEYSHGGHNVENIVTRAMFIAAVLETFRLPFNLVPKEAFNDINPFHKYYPPLMSARAMGIIVPDGDRFGNSYGTIRPDEPMTKAEGSEILHRVVLRMCEGLAAE